MRAEALVGSRRWDVDLHFKATTDAETRPGPVQRATAGTKVLSFSSRFGWRRRDRRARLAALVDKVARKNVIVSGAGERITPSKPIPANPNKPGRITQPTRIRFAIQPNSSSVVVGFFSSFGVAVGLGVFLGADLVGTITTAGWVGVGPGSTFGRAGGSPNQMRPYPESSSGPLSPISSARLVRKSVTC